MVNELEQALRSVPDVTKPTLEYVVVKPTVEEAALIVRVECATTGDEAEVGRRCETAVKEQLGIDASVEVLARDTLPRSGYKATRLVSE